VRSAENIYMDGMELMTFGLREVPAVIEETLAVAGWQRESVGLYGIHQTSKFMVEYLAKTAALPKGSVPIGMTETGNTGPASIPLLLSIIRSDFPSERRKRSLLCGYGVGFSWGACALDLSKTEILPLVELDRGAHTGILNYKNSGVRPPVPRIAEPLLGSRLPVAIKDTVFEARLGSQTPALLTDHQVFERPVFPAAGFIGMAFAAGKQALSSSHLQIDNLVMGQALVLPDHVRTQTVLAMGTNRLAFRVSSHPQQDQTIKDDNWRLHASGQISVLPQDHASFKADLSQLGHRFGQELSVGEVYEQFREVRGLNYGTGFQVIERLHHIENEAFGRLCVPEAAQRDQYSLHPVLLDGAIQILLMSFPQRLSQETYLPIGLERCWISQEYDTSGWAHARLRPSDSDDSEVLIGDVRLFDEEGTVFFEGLGLSFKRTDQESVLRLSQLNRTRQSRQDSVSLPAVPSGFVDKLRQVNGPERTSLLRAYVRPVVARVLEVKPDQIADDTLLSRLGLDSLRALELRNQVETDLSLDIPMVKFLQKISVSRLVSTLDMELAESLSERLTDLTSTKSTVDFFSAVVVAGEV
jgi:acyl carrier protein